MALDFLRLRHTLLEFESELLNQEALSADRVKATHALEAMVVQREDRLRELTAALAAHQARIADLEAEIAAGRSRTPDPDWSARSLASKIETCMPVLDGWCTPDKAAWLTRFIVDRQMRSVIEIGIFGGKSLVPIALALQETGGTAIGVEPWSNKTALAEATNETNDAWWSTVDLAAIRARFFSNAVQFDVVKNLRVFEMDYDQAFALMGLEVDTSFDLVHIDGAHSPERALKDVVNWSSLVRNGGLVVLDDIAWPTVAAARTFLTERFDVVDEVFADGGVSYGAYQVRGASQDGPGEARPGS